MEAIACNKKVFTYKQDNVDYYPVPNFKKLPFIFSNNLKELEINLFSFLNGNDSLCKSTKFMPSNSVKNIVKLINKV